MWNFAFLLENNALAVKRVRTVHVVYLNMKQKKIISI